jgi:branched-chain amino acid transport system permease protein
MYAIMASAFNIICGFAGYVSFGQVAFYGIGAYTTAITMKNWGTSFFLTIPLAGVLGAVIAAVLGFIVLRLRGSYFIIATIGLTLIIDTVVTNFKEVTGGGVGISLPLLPYPMWLIKTIFYYAMLIVMLATLFVSYLIRNSRFGIFLFSIRENEDAAEAMGVNTTRYKILAFTISALFTAMAGGIYAPYMSYIDPPTVFAISTTIMIILMTVFGGRGTLLGPVIGAAILICLSDFLIGLIASELNMAIYGALLVAVIIFMPHGIIGVIREKLPRLRNILK